MRLTQRLVVGSSLVISVLVIVALALSGGRLRAQLRDLVAQQLTREARLVALEWRPGVEPDAIANAAGAALGHRVTLIDDSGRVTGDSDFDGPSLAALQNHAARPEVAAARATGVGVAERTSPSEGSEELYVAVRAPLGIARVSIGTAQLLEIVARAQRDVAISGLIALLIALALAVVFARQVSAPIVELRDVARAIAAGDLSRRPALSAPGEVGDLASAVHRMAEQLDSRLAALESEDALLGAVVDSLHEGVIAVDARRQVVRVNAQARRLLALRHEAPFSADLLPRERVLRDALTTALGGRAAESAETQIESRTLAISSRALAGGGAVLAVYDLTALRRLELVRRDFVANVSHELKTPLTVIRGFAETLGGDDASPKDRARFTQAIRGNAERMQHIVDDLLDLSRIESGGWVPSPSRVDIAAAASEAVAPYRATAAERGVTLAVEVADDAREAIADATAVRQIIGNLVENAVRYTSGGGAVTVFSRADVAGVWIGTRDTGVGIAAEHLPRIFERFYRADAARSRAAGGTGLGLSIVKHLTEAHGGRVHAESAPARGTTVMSYFPSTDNA
ncbi:MAG: ATP-binding protein [Gemmatimonadaceae bacterium]